MPSGRRVLEPALALLESSVKFSQDDQVVKSNTEWQKWGERDPLFAVSTWPGKARGESAAWTDEEFYELGRSDWADFIKQWQQYGVDPRHCVEIGCGAGRLTKQLAQCFEQVSAVDVSQHQLDYATSRIAARNVHFLLTNGVTLPLPDANCTAAFSAHVFQHFDTHSDAFRVFQEISRVLQPGGSLMIHLPIYQLPDMPVASLFRPVISLVKQMGNVRAAIQRHYLKKGKWRFIMRRLRFERDPLFGLLRSLGFTEIEFRSFAVRSNCGYHDFVFARKPV